MRFLLLLIGLCASASASAVKSVPAFVRIVLLEREANLTEGQERRLSVKLYSESWLRKAPRYPELNVEGALVVRPSSFATHGQETIDNRDYIVQEQIYRIYPQRLGAFYIPPLSLSVGLAKGAQRSIQLQSNDLLFTVKRGNGLRRAADVQWQQTYRLIAGERSLVLTEGDEWDVRVGDIIERTITMTAAQTTAVLLPSFELLHADNTNLEGSLGAAPNLALKGEQQFSRGVFSGGEVYRQILRLEDEENRGDVLAIREESWRYSVQSNDVVSLPELSFSYWDTEQDEAIELSLAGQQISLNEPFSWLALIYCGLIALCVFAVVRLAIEFRSSCYKRLLGVGSFASLNAWYRERKAWGEITKSVKCSLRGNAQSNTHLEQLTLLIQKWLKLWPANRLDPLINEPGFESLRQTLFSSFRQDRLIAADELPHAKDRDNNKVLELIEMLKILRRELKSTPKPLIVEKNVCLPPLNPTSTD